MSRHLVFTAPSLVLPRARRKVQPLWRRILSALTAWQERANQRRALAQLDDHVLRDIGVTRGQLLAQLGRSRWDD